MRDHHIKIGFLIAAAFNILGMGIFTHGLTNRVLFETDPEMFSVPGCVLVMTWGLAYAAQSRTWLVAPGVTAVFAVEKLIFAGWWVRWMILHAGELGAIRQRSALAGAFYGAYGLGDAAFMVFFAWAARRAWVRATP